MSKESLRLNDVVLYITASRMSSLYDEVHGFVDQYSPQWDGTSDIRLKSVPWVVFRVRGNNE